MIFLKRALILFSLDITKSITPRKQSRSGTFTIHGNEYQQVFDEVLNANNETVTYNLSIPPNAGGENQVIDLNDANNDIILLDDQNNEIMRCKFQ